MNWKLLFHTIVCGLLTTWWIWHSPLNKWLVAAVAIASYVLGLLIAKKMFPRKES